MTPAYAGVTVILILAAISLFISSPAAATLVITKESFSPIPPLTGSEGQHAVITITVIPSGATTFSRTHTLQMQTSLVNARWNIQVNVNGIPAAQQSASGTSAFVNGYLLSYPTTSDVSVTVILDGTVPAKADTNVTILQAAELDTAGITVPGSSLSVVTPCIPSSPEPVISPQVTVTTLPAATPVTTRFSGLLPVTCLLASIVAAAGYGYIRARR